jgi:hypothetical protein
MRLQGLLDEPPPGGRGNHDKRARALLVLGRPFGATTDAPAGQSVADARWTWLAGRRAHRRLWEVKTGGAERVPRDWVDQLLGQMQVERSNGLIAWSWAAYSCSRTNLSQKRPLQHTMR